MATLFQFNPFHIRGETYMAKIHWGLACLLLFVTAAVAQEHYTEGPVWRVTLVRVKPAQMDAYLTSLRQATKPLLEEEKRTGVIVDYISWPRFFQFNPFHIQGETYMAKMHWALACLLVHLSGLNSDQSNSPDGALGMVLLRCRRSYEQHAFWRI